MAIQIQLRRGLAATWTTNNPTLAQGEMGLETDTGKFKVGDGSTAWSTLVYSSGIQGIQGIQGISPLTTSGSLTAALTTTAATETLVTNNIIPANSLAVGSTYRILAYGIRTGTNTATATYNIRIGTTTAANAGTIAATGTVATTATASVIKIEGLVTVRTTGASGTVLGSVDHVYGTTPLVTNTTTAVAVDTTSVNYLKLTMNSGTTNTYTFYVASIQQVY
jgi:hypothetical protein